MSIIYHRAWDFVDALPEDEKFEVVTINPSIVLGPNITTAFSEVSINILSVVIWISDVQ